MDNDEKFREKVVQTHEIYSGHILDLQKQSVVTPQGHHTSREVVRHAQAVALLMINDHDQMILVEQWRSPVNRLTLEIPAGKVDDRDNHDVVHAANREMNEETRLSAKHLERVTASYSSPGFTDEKITLFYAHDLSPVKSELPQDQDENLKLVEVSLKQALEMVKTGKIDDMKTVMAIFYWASLKEQK